MSSQPKTFFTPEEYLQLERKAEFKSEYFQGEIFAMSGASRRRILIVTNLLRELSQLLKSKPCEVYGTDMRLSVLHSGLYTYPDVTVACEPKFLDGHFDTLLNPLVIVEVLSDSTRNYDRRGKFDLYRSLDSLREYITIDQNRPHIESYVRQPENTWLLTDFRELQQTVHLPSLDCDLPLAEIYLNVDWAA